MARGINRVTLIGRLGADPETRYTQSGVAVTNISIATTESWKDQSGEKQERTEWHKVIFFNRLAEIAGEYLKKGSNVYIEGKLQTRKWQDQNGQDRWTTEIVANEMQMLDSQGGDRSQINRQPQPQPQPQRQQQPQQQRQPQQHAPEPGHDYDDFGQDIPF